MRRSSPGPQFLTCYICGRQFGKSSLGIHEPQCIRKWESEQELLEPEFRTARPVKPEKLQGVRAGGGRRAMEEHNMAAAEAYDKNMAECPNCGRTFLPERLQIHLRSCHTDAPAKSIKSKQLPRSSSQAGTTYMILCLFLFALCHAFWSY